MLGRADEGLCPALRKRQRHYGMGIGIIRTTMTELNTSRLFHNRATIGDANSLAHALIERQGQRRAIQWNISAVGDANSLAHALIERQGQRRASQCVSGCGEE